MTVVSARGVVSKNSTTVIELNQAIREITEAARAVRVFANTLEAQCPEAAAAAGRYGKGTVWEGRSPYLYQRLRLGGVSEVQIVAGPG